MNLFEDGSWGDASSYHMAFGGIFPLDEMRAWEKNRDGVLMATCIYKWQLAFEPGMGRNSIDTTLLILIHFDFHFVLVMLCRDLIHEGGIVYMKPARCIEAQSRCPSKKLHEFLHACVSLLGR